MNAGIKRSREEHICCCSAVSALIFFKNRRSREANVVAIMEMFLDVAVHFAELRTVAFVNNEYAFFISKRSHYIFIFLVFDSACHFLNSRYDKRFIRIDQVIHKCCGAVGVINTALLEAVVFINSLVVQVFAVDQEEYLFNFRIITKQTRKLIACEGLARTCGVKHKAIQVTAENTIHSLFDSVNLVRAHSHNNRLCFLDNHKLREHFSQRKFVKEVSCKLTEPINTHIFSVCPVEGKGFQDMLFCPVCFSLIGICKVFCLHTV